MSPILNPFRQILLVGSHWAILCLPWYHTLATCMQFAFRMNHTQALTVTLLPWFRTDNYKQHLSTCLTFFTFTAKPFILSHNLTSHSLQFSGTVIHSSRIGMESIKAEMRTKLSICYFVSQIQKLLFLKSKNGEERNHYWITTLDICTCKR